MISNLGTKASRRGFSLVEMAIVLGVLGVILGSLWGVVGLVRKNMKRDQAFNQIFLVVQNVRDFYLGRAYVETPGHSGSFSDLTHYLLAQGVLPAEMIRDRSANPLRADLPWGAKGASGSALAEGGFAIDNGGGSSVSGQFRIQLRGLSFADCAALASRLSGPSGPASLLGVKINNSNKDAPVSVEDANDACEEEPSGIRNQLDFTYRLRVR